MKCFIAIEEDALEELWLKHPELVGPFTRPFLPSELAQNKLAPSELAPRKLAPSHLLSSQRLSGQSVRLKPSANDAEPSLKT